MISHNPDDVFRIFAHVASGTVPIGYAHEYGALQHYHRTFLGNHVAIWRLYAAWLRNNCPSKIEALTIFCRLGQ